MVSGPLPRCAVIAAVLLATACEREPTRIELPDEQVLVQSVLVAGQDTARVIALAVRYDPVSREMVLEELDAWSVELRTGTETFVLQRVDDVSRCAWVPHTEWGSVAGPGCHVAAVPGGVRSGVTYELLIFLRSGEVVRGRATVPEPPEIHSPAPGTRIPGEWVASSLRATEPTEVGWASTPETASIGLAGAVVRLYLGGEEQEWRGCRVADGGALLHPDRQPEAWEAAVWGCTVARYTGTVRPDSVEMDLLVFAHDDAYTRYVEGGAGGVGSVRWGDVSMNLDGAVGLFSGAAAAPRRVLLYNEELGGGLDRR